MKEKVIQIKKLLNPVAQMHLISTASYKTLIAGRGFSKSFTNGLEVADKVERFPGSCGLFNSPTYTMIYTKTLIPMKAAWQQHLSYHEGIHYVVGKAPPKHWGKPWHKPHKYENVVTFWNGTTVIFGSFDRPQLISGGSYDWVITDEAYMINKEDYDNYVIPSVRPTHPSFRDKPKHLQHSFTSSMPYNNQGDWLLDYLPKSKQNPENYSFIGWAPNVQIQKGSTWMNHEVLGKKAIAQMELEMAPHRAKVMIRNERLKGFGNLFYPSLSAKHLYIPKASDKIILLNINSLNGKRDASYDVGADNYNPRLPINITHDWGAFNCIWIDQEFPREVRFIDTMDVEHPLSIDDLADQFAERYAKHENKIIFQWGDKSGNNRVANSKLSYFEQFAERLRDDKHGWRVVRKKTGDIEHLERHRFIIKLHNEEDPRLPKVRHNATTCADAIISLESAPMKDNKKDKSSEGNTSIKPQHATHYSDAYDYRLYHGFHHLERDGDTYNPYGTSLTE
jgi:hypothetical protein